MGFGDAVSFRGSDVVIGIDVTAGGGVTTPDSVGFAENVGSVEVMGTVCPPLLGSGVAVTGAGVSIKASIGSKVSSAAPSEGTSSPSV